VTTVSRKGEYYEFGDIQKKVITHDISSRSKDKYKLLEQLLKQGALYKESTMLMENKIDELEKERIQNQ
jgi:hypothetical protein